MPTELETYLQRRSPYLPRLEGMIWEHFITNTQAANWSYTAGGTGATSSLMAGAPGRPGIQRALTGTTATGFMNFRFGAPGSIIIGNNCLWEFYASVRLTQLATSAENFDLAIGLTNATAGVLPTSGIYIYYDLDFPNWQARCINSGVASTVDTGVAAIANDWEDFKIIVNPTATQVEFYNNETLTNVVTNNIPSSALAPTLQVIKSAGLTARSYDLDYCHVFWDATP